MKRCTVCVLPETFPGVQLDETGVCMYCRTFKGRDALEESKEKHRARFDELFRSRRRRGSHDCLMAYSGGKDSTYTMVVLRERYDASILALTVDNGFVSPAALTNIRSVVEKLGVDHILYKPRFDLMCALFRRATDQDIYSRKTLERASTICTTCMGIVKFLALRMAVESGIPFITYGWSPGQAPIEASIFQNNPSMIRSMQKVLLEPMRAVAGDEIERYFLTEEHFAMADRFPHNISPLAFFDYDEEAIIERIGELGWKKPDDTDPNSTNCLLNAFANKVHRERFKFNPYAFELAKLVREGYMSRDEAIARLEEPENPEIIGMVRKRLGID
jgi:tRNA(Ile)-lysidine synthase TilS/MesJ